MTEGKEVTWFPSYGAEIRGGTANCTIIVSSEMIGSPIVRNPDILITLNSLSYDRFYCFLKSGGTLLYDASLFSPSQSRRDVIARGVPAFAIALTCGGSSFANMVMLGALIAITGISSIDSVIRSLAPLVKKQQKDLLGANAHAIRKGYETFYDSQGSD